MLLLLISPPPPYFHTSSSDPEELRTSELAQQTLTDFIHSLISQCLTCVRKKLEKEVCVHTMVLVVTKFTGHIESYCFHL